MTRLQLVIFGVAIVGACLVTIALACLRNARDAGERFDEVMRDHYSDEEGDQ